jgi:hypothetical protein
MPAPRLVSLKGSDFTGLGIECYGGLKDGIFVKKVAPQGPASGQISIGKLIGAKRSPPINANYTPISATNANLCCCS